MTRRIITEVLEHERVESSAKFSLSREDYQKYICPSIILAITSYIQRVPTTRDVSPQCVRLFKTLD
jgi:hypothetical protein